MGNLLKFLQLLDAIEDAGARSEFASEMSSLGSRGSPNDCISPEMYSPRGHVRLALESVLVIPIVICSITPQRSIMGSNDGDHVDREGSTLDAKIDLVMLAAEMERVSSMKKRNSGVPPT